MRPGCEFSATRQLARQLGVPVVMHRLSPAPFVDLRLEGGELLVVGHLRLQSMYTPGHTVDSMCLCVEDRVFTGDTLLIGATGRTDLPSGDAGALYESLFQGVLRLDPAVVTTTLSETVPAASAMNVTDCRDGSLVIFPPLMVHW